MAENENITRFRRCREMLLKDLVKFSIIILGGFTIFSILFWWSLGFEYFTYTWIIGTILLGPIDLVWYIVILFNCNHLVSSARQG